MREIRKVGIVCCSNGQRPVDREINDRLAARLAEGGVETVFSPFLYTEDGLFAGSAAQRAQAVNQFYQDETIDAVFDISGGDLANQLLDRLDYEAITGADKEFWGYSDLTTLLNGIYRKTGKTGVLYQIRNLVGDWGEERCREFFAPRKKQLFCLPCQFLQGESMSGTVVGGNIRCLLKLAGTEYFPDLTNTLLLLEANSGRVAQMATYLSQLQQLGAFDKIKGIILGTFTQMEREECSPTIEQLILEYAGSIPIAKTALVGHGANARAVTIGGCYRTCHRAEETTLEETDENQ